MRGCAVCGVRCVVCSVAIVFPLCSKVFVCLNSDLCCLSLCMHVSRGADSRDLESYALSDFIFRLFSVMCRWTCVGPRAQTLGVLLSCALSSVESLQVSSSFLGPLESESSGSDVPRGGERCWIDVIRVDTSY